MSTAAEKIELRTAAKVRLIRIAIPLMALVVGTGLWRASFAKPEIAPSRNIFAAFTLVAAVLFIWATFAWRSGFVADAKGVVKRTAFRTRRIAWSEVDSLHDGWFVHEVGASVGDRRVVARYDGNGEERRRAVEFVLQRAPKLQGIAWGTGVANVERPAAPPAPLPDSIQLFAERIEIHGPGPTLLRLDDELADYARRKELVRARLARMMLGEFEEAWRS